MEWLNYHHLLYFWVVAREGGLGPAGEKLRLAQSTLSGQIKSLEEMLGQSLFERRGRGLVLTDTGRMVFRYAEEIFSLGQELLDTLKDRPVGLPIRVTIGIADAVPKLAVRRLLEPALAIPGGVKLTCLENKPENLLAELALHNLDAVIMDAPAAPNIKIKAFSRLLLESEVLFFGSPNLRHNHGENFPNSLDGAPVLLPTRNTALRHSLENAFKNMGVSPKIMGEFEDAALLKEFGRIGLGLFPASGALQSEIERDFQVAAMGAIPDVLERYYMITVERKIKHPAIATIGGDSTK